MASRQIRNGFQAVVPFLLMEPTMRNWGEDEEPLLGAAVKDPAGNSWYFAGPQ